MASGVLLALTLLILTSGCWLYRLTPRPSACPLLPSGGFVGPAELGFGQALCKTLIERHILQRVNLASAAAGQTLHSSRPRINGYSLPNTKTKNNAKTSTLAEMTQLQLRTWLSCPKKRSKLPKVTQLPAPRLVPIYALVFCFIGFFFFFFGHAAQHLGSQFPSQGSSSSPPHWKHGVLITGPPGESYQSTILLYHNA